MAERLSVSKILDESVAEEILEKVKNIESPRWIRRTELPSIRGLEGETCQYDFCGHAQMEKSLRIFLKDLAPKYDNFFLAEIAVNHYKVGDYIGRHKDRHLYRRNLVIALQEKGDGLLVENDEFISDKIGQGVLFEGVGPVHSVPPVKNDRYCLIYLYE
jgi:hypothetical protein